MDYFDRLEKETNHLYEIANEARSKGLDVETQTEVPLAKDLAERILEGTIDIMPYRKDSGNTPCIYCEYAGVCQFDSSVDGSNFRRIKKLKKDEILLEFLNEGGEDA